MLEIIKQRLGNKIISIKQTRDENGYIDDDYTLQVKCEKYEYYVHIMRHMNSNLHGGEVINECTLETCALLSESLEELIDEVLVTLDELELN